MYILNALLFAANFDYVYDKKIKYGVHIYISHVKVNATCIISKLIVLMLESQLYKSIVCPQHQLDISECLHLLSMLKTRFLNYWL